MKNNVFETEKSKLLYDQAQNYIVGGIASTMHKSEMEGYPIYVEKGKGSHVIDVNGNEYIDYLGGYGPILLGFTPDSVMKAVIDQVSEGTLYAAPFNKLNAVSKKIIEMIPCAERVLYETTGTEAVMLALRIARAFTGKEKIVRFEGHYHGWADELLVSNAPNSLKMMGPRNRPWKVMGSSGQRAGSVEDVIVVPWNDIDILKQVIKRQGHEIAAIITEPVMLNCEVVTPLPGYLESLKELCESNEIILIFDEIITGFRLALGGAQDYYKVKPDLSTFAKSVASGYPLAGVVGRKGVMESNVHPLGTFNGNPISIAACEATIKELTKPGFYTKLDQITDRITKGITEISNRLGIILNCAHVGSIWWIQFGVSEPLKEYRDSFKVDKLKYQKLRELCQQRGLRLHPTRGRLYTSAAHTDEDVDRTLEIFEESFRLLNNR